MSNRKQLKKQLASVFLYPKSNAELQQAITSLFNPITYGETNKKKSTLEENFKNGLTHYTLDYYDKSFDNYTHEIYYFCNQLFTKNQNHLSIDGCACTGKTTLIQKFPNFKINKVMGNELDYYNINPCIALAYLMLYCKCIEESKNLLFDRSPFSNIAYMLCYYLMSQDGKNEKLTTYGKCIEFIQMHNLVPVFEYLKAKKFNILFIIDSDYQSVKQRMKERGTPGDYTKSNFQQYIMYQCAAFGFISKICDIPCFDINYIRQKYNIPTNEILSSMQSIFSQKILSNINIDEVIYPQVLFQSCELPNFERNHLIATNIHGR